MVLGSVDPWNDFCNMSNQTASFLHLSLDSVSRIVDAGVGVDLNPARKQFQYPPSCREPFKLLSPDSPALSESNDKNWSSVWK